MVNKIRDKLHTKYKESVNSAQIYESSLVQYLSSYECLDKIREDIKINLIPYLLLLCKDEYEPIYTESKSGENVYFSVQKVRDVSGEYFPLVIHLLRNYPVILDYMSTGPEDDLYCSIGVSEELRIHMIKFELDSCQDYEYEYSARETDHFQYIEEKVRKEFMNRLEEILLEDISLGECSYVLTYVNEVEKRLFHYLKDKYSHFYDESPEYNIYNDIIEHNKDLFDKDKVFLLKDINNYIKSKYEKDGNI